MKYIFFLFNEIKNNKFYFFRYSSQFVILVILLGMCISLTLSLLNFKNKFDIFIDTPEMYIIRDETEGDLIEHRLFSDEITASKKLFELYDYIIESTEHRSYTYIPQYIRTNSPAKGVDILETIDKSTYYKAINIDQQFWNIFKLCCQGESNSIAKKFFSAGNENEIILGANYKSSYCVGESFENGYTVIGFLKPSLFFLSPGQTDEVIYLDDYILLPVSISENSPVSELDQAITSCTIITSSSDSLNSIAEKSNELELYDLSFISYEEQLKNITNSYLSMIYTLFVLITLIFIFCSVCIITSAKNYIENHYREFVIHMLCGACKADFILSIFIRHSFVLLLANIVSLVVFGISLVYLFLFVASLLIILLLSIIPAIRIEKITISELLATTV